MLIDTLNVTYTSTADATVSVYLKVFGRLFKHVAVVLWMHKNSMMSTVDFSSVCQSVPLSSPL